jgi:hypothetical protein
LRRQSPLPEELSLIEKIALHGVVSYCRTFGYRFGEQVLILPGNDRFYPEIDSQHPPAKVRAIVEVRHSLPSNEKSNEPTIGYTGCGFCLGPAQRSFISGHPLPTWC